MSIILEALRRRDMSPIGAFFAAFVTWCLVCAVEAISGHTLPHMKAVFGSVIGLGIGMWLTNTFDIWRERRAKEPRHD